MRQASLLTSFRYVDQYPQAIRCIADGTMPIRKIVTRRFPFADARKAFGKCLSRSDSEDVAEKAVVFPA